MLPCIPPLLPLQYNSDINNLQALVNLNDGPASLPT
jgi:hypothetical protein